MPKDSQPDNKEARMEKCNGQTPSIFYRILKIGCRKRLKKNCN